MSLKSWAQTHISALYEAQSDHDLHEAFEATFAPSPEIFINHERVSRESMKDDLTKRRGAAIFARVKWENVMVVPKNADRPEEVRSCDISG